MKQMIKKIPGINVLKDTYSWKALRHRITLISDNRENSTFTGFLRLPTQFEALSGPVLDFLLVGGGERTLKITVMGCSNGAEAYTIASVLKNQYPELSFRVNAYDIDRGMVDKAKTMTYAPDEIFNNKVITDSFVNSTFDIINNLYKIKQKITEHVSFDVIDALNPHLNRVIGTSDIIFSQNFLLHMKPELAKRAFLNICTILNQKSALFIDGMDIGMRQSLTRKNKMVPLEYEIEKIHNEARRARGIGWPYSYWGLEPYSGTRKDRQRRYSTIFLKMTQ